MPTSSIPKPAPVRKSVPIKWRDSAWSPRILIRSLAPRSAGYSFGDQLPRTADWAFGPERFWPTGMPGLRRAGESLPGFGEPRLLKPTLPFRYGPSRFPRFSRLDHLF